MAKEVLGNISKGEQRYLNIAINLARSSLVNRYKHGAIIVKGGRIISTGINKIRNHPDVFGESTEIKKHSHIHAEIDAMRKVSDLRNAKIYVARINNNGKTGLSRPCDNCYNSILEAGITRIVYT